MYQTWCKVIFVALIISSIGVVSSFGIPFEMKYQGYIEVGGVPYTGMATTFFSLLDSPSSPTTNYWTNDNSHPSPGTRPLGGVAVTVTNGVFTLNLGDTTRNMYPIYSSVFANESVYLRFWYKAGSNKTVLGVPDEKMASVGYAFNAVRVNGRGLGHGLNNIPVNDYTLSTGLNADMLDNQQGSFYRNASNLNAGTVPSDRLTGSYSNASVDYANWAGNASSADNAISASSSGNSNLLNGQPGSYYLDAGNLTGIVSTERLIGEYGSATTGYALNAGLLNGQDSSYYLDAGNLTGIVSTERLIGAYSSATAGYAFDAELLNGESGSYYLNAANLTGTVSSERLIGEYGSVTSGYASDAGLLNGQNSSYYLDAENLTGIVPTERLVGVYNSATAGYAADAGLLNGQSGSYYLNAGNLTGTIASSQLVGEYSSATTGYAADAGLLNGQSGSYYLNAGNLTGAIASSQLVGEYGSATTGYAADAGLLNGQNGSYYLNAGNLTGTIASSQLVGEYGSATAGYTADAGLLNGQNGSYYLNAGNQTGVVPSSRMVGIYGSATVGYTADAGLLNGQDSSYYLNAGNLTGVLPSSSLVGGYGSASVAYALEADTLDGLHSTEFLKPIYDAIVAPSGGDYTNIQDALTAGKKTIYVRNGTYASWDRIRITQDGTSIIGESRDGVVITGYEFMMGGGIYVDGYEGTYSDGSCYAEAYSYYITGYSVSWTSDMVGRCIQLGGVWYEITGVPSSNTLMLKNRYHGNNTLFTSYQITGFIKDVRLENLSIVSSGHMDESLQLNYTKDVVVKNCYISSESMEMFRIWSSIGGLIEDNIIEGSMDYACTLYDCDYFTIRNNVIQQNEWSGLQLYNSDNNMIIGNRLNANNAGIMMNGCYNNLFANNQCKYNRGSGIYVYENSERNQFDSNDCSNNGESGIYCTSTTARNSITNNVCYSNGNSGIFIGNPEAANVDEMMISNNRCESNTQYGIEYCGSDSALTGNICKSNGYQGMLIKNGTGNRLDGNVCNFNTSDGIKLEASSCNSITNSRGKSNGAYGINISDASCLNNIVLGCHITGNTTLDYYNAGTGTQQAHNYQIVE